MATPRTASVVDVRQAGAHSVLLDLLSGEPLGFLGGQYVIVDTGRVLPSGKTVKRAYSLLSADVEQQRFQLAVDRVPGGPGSDFMHELDRGSELRFSGPWGKLFPQGEPAGSTLVLATDTGITAAIGLVQGARFAPFAATTTVLWLTPPAGPFLLEALVRERVHAAHAELHVGELPAIHHPERAPHARALLRERLGGRLPGQAFLAGDFAVIAPALEDLVEAGMPATQGFLEPFFNMPRKST